MTLRARLLTATGVLLAVALAGCTSVGPTDDRGNPSPTGVGAAGPIGTGHEVIVHLFEWNWASVAAECPRLAEVGYGAVQVSPPQEHLSAPPYQWWQDYQPVSYRIESRRGGRADFRLMVEACHTAGVRVYVDAVINHMSGAESGTGTAGSTFTHYDYPGLWGAANFHHCGLAANDDIADYGNAQQVQTCELVNLADLATDTEPVRARLATYLNDLVSLGVDGFRIDAAKHMAAADVASIVGRLSRPVDVYQEVIDFGTEPITAADYTGSGKVTVFPYGAALGKEVQWGQLANLKTLGGSVDSTKAVVFVDNHDNQRHGGSEIATYANNPKPYLLANVFMLGWGYGTPVVMSSYAFTDADAGPPAGADGRTSTATCGVEWTCEHRLPAIAGMVGLHDVALGQPVVDWWDDGANVVGFGRGDRAFVAMNNNPGAKPGLTFRTHLPAGDYCDVVVGLPHSDGSCAGRTIAVGADGSLTVDLGGFEAVAIHVTPQP